MSRHRGLAWLLMALIGLGMCPAPVEARAPQTARERYESARAREAEARDQAEHVAAADDDTAMDRATRAVRRVVVQYESLVRRFPTSGYSDNALFHAGSLSQWLHARHGHETDRAAASNYFMWLDREYPASPLRREARVAAQALMATTPRPASVAAPAPRPRQAAAPPSTLSAVSPPAAAPVSSTQPAAVTSTAERPPRVPSPVARVEPPATLQAIDHVVIDGGVRVTLTLDREAPFTHDVLAAPPRAFVDLAGTSLSEALRGTALRFETDAVRQVRVGRRAEAVRVVVDLAERAAISVFTLYNPFRVVIDAESSSVAPVAPTPSFAMAPPSAPFVPASSVSTPAVSTPSASAAIASATAAAAPVPWAGSVTPSMPPAVERQADVAPAALDAALAGDPGPTVAPVAPAPVVPSANADGTYSLARQLGLGVSRIVIDPGHGGHDPGTLTSGSTEARLVLDVALRLEKLLEKDGFDVVLTRRTDVFIPLEERTAIANREGADLFLSIHANSGRDPAARGVEVYYLSFASNPDAEAVAARENATATGAMHNLPGIVRAIALNNKLDESRDFAQLVQRSLASRLAKVNVGLRNRGVKKAPFVVLIGANMPSVLAEVGFITNKQEAGLIKTPAYRQRIAESLQAAVAQYRRALKRQGTVATR